MIRMNKLHPKRSVVRNNGRMQSASRSGRALAWLLTLLFSSDILMPTLLWAGSGPGQPEFSSFSPASASELVDPFTGDLSYNIPLMEVDGYPINIFYNSDITMDQEASWVGLGWNLNVGSISRSMRGMPDDMNADPVENQNWVKPDISVGLKYGLSAEIFGVGIGGAGLSLGYLYNTYYGSEITKGFSLNLAPIKALKDNLTIGLSAESSGKNGVSLYPRISISAAAKKSKTQFSALSYATSSTVGLSVGAGFSSRAGLQSVSVTPSVSHSRKLSLALGAKEFTLFQKSRGGVALPSMSFDLGTPTYYPSGSNWFKNTSVTGSFTGGSALITAHGSYNIAGSYSKQKIQNTSETRAAYGYYYLQGAASGVGSKILDFNREKDGGVSKDIPALALAGYTYDIFSVQGQGVGGSYRLMRSDIGHVADGRSGSNGFGGALDVEIGVGNTAHSGGKVVVNDASSENGEWKKGNAAAGLFSFSAPSGVKEAAYFVEASEPTLDPDPERYLELGGADAVRVGLREAKKFDVRTERRLETRFGGSTGYSLPGSVVEPKRRPRSKVLSVLTRAELLAARPSTYAALPLFEPAQHMHHFAQFTTLNEEGKRFVYGIAAYNTEQHDVTFAVPSTDISDGIPSNVTYNHNEWNSVNNRVSDSRDQYYQRSTLPPYAHSFLLTEILSPEYADVDNDEGPSMGDLGDWLKFSYTRTVADYGWRSPTMPQDGCSKASFSVGAMGRTDDDKASYMYGKKELWYLQEVRSRDHVAVFTISDRGDVCSVREDGCLETGLKQSKLDRIDLYSRQEYEAHEQDLSQATPIQSVHFVYDYSLCPGASLLGTGGKLTLKEVRFTFQNSALSAKAPYKFGYGDVNSLIDNPPYLPDCVDRWGTIKADKGSASDAYRNAVASGLDVSEASFTHFENRLYPYVDDRTDLGDRYAQAWQLKSVDLPSGGRQEFVYEADRYGYVQDRPVTKMFRVHSCRAVDGTVPIQLENVRRLYFDLDTDIPIGENTIDRYVNVGDMVYFNVAVNILGTSSPNDRVPGYAVAEAVGIDNLTGVTRGFVQFAKVKLHDSGSDEASPICMAAINYGKTTYQDRILVDPGVGLDESSSFGADLLGQVLGIFTSSIISDFFSALTPNRSLLNQGKCVNYSQAHNWIRLRDPNRSRVGGGARVKKVIFRDAWSGMTDAAEPSVAYGQEYRYVLKDGSCSGVASYEPMVGGDENPLRQPETYNVEKLLIPDVSAYQEHPFGEMFYPSPRVGYSRVEVVPMGNDIEGGTDQVEVNRHGVGRTVHEFYTAKDYPVFCERTQMDKKPQKSKFSLGSLFKFRHREHMTVSQGFCIQTNAMHGKPKLVEEYQQGAQDPYKYTSYKYKDEIFMGARRLVNDATVMKPDGTLEQARIGVIYDACLDTRESKSTAVSVGLAFNTEGFVIVLPLLVVPIWPSYSNSENIFRSASMTKVIQRFGLIDEVVQYDNGSSVSTRNLAYDAETGQVLLTSVQDHFENPVYSQRFPAHWYYDGMGGAYRNEGARYKGVSFSGNGEISGVQAAGGTFVKGDELLIGEAPSAQRGYVSNVEGDQVFVIKQDGTPMTGSNMVVKILRSGRRNLLGMDMASMTSLSDPRTAWGNNYYKDILAASAVEYDQYWRTNCECTGALSSANNPFVVGTQGIWRPRRSYTYLSDRHTQITPASLTGTANTIDIRTDGTFLDFSPFYRIQDKKWVKEPRSWTFVEELLDVDPIGHPLETRNAIGIPSASTYAHSGYHVSSSAANAKYREIGFASFEDASLAECLDEHFFFQNKTLVTDDAHTGRHAVRVSAGQTSPTRVVVPFVDCDDPGCNMAVTAEVVVNSQTPGMDVSVFASGGNGVPALEYEILDGLPSIGISGDGLMITAASGAWSVQVKACDASGCCSTTIINSTDYD